MSRRCALAMVAIDGKWLAFSGDYYGNLDVFVMPAEGGEPRRLTHHPSPESVAGWTSDGKRIPWYFRKGASAGRHADVGRSVGFRDYPELIDGGSVTAPRGAIYGLQDEWEVENRGIAPDIEVEMDPALVRQGRDPQLEKRSKWCSRS